MSVFFFCTLPDQVHREHVYSSRGEPGAPTGPHLEDPWGGREQEELPGTRFAHHCPPYAISKWERCFGAAWTPMRGYSKSKARRHFLDLLERKIVSGYSSYGVQLWKATLQLRRAVEGEVSLFPEGHIVDKEMEQAATKLQAAQRGRAVRERRAQARAAAAAAAAAAPGNSNTNQAHEDAETAKQEVQDAEEAVVALAAAAAEGEREVVDAATRIQKMQRGKIDRRCALQRKLLLDVENQLPPPVPFQLLSQVIVRRFLCSCVLK
eukprot:COSAG05_NODE_204_length_14187_cov_99.887422_3_plen_265_part_00